MTKCFTEEQIIGILRQAEAGGVVIRDLCRKHNITEQTFFRWRNKYNGMTVPEARRLKDLEAENAKLKKLLAEQYDGHEGEPCMAAVEPIGLNLPKRPDGPARRCCSGTSPDAARSARQSLFEWHGWPRYWRRFCRS